MKKHSAPILLVALAALLFGLPTSASAVDFSLFASYYDTDDFGEAAGVGARLAFFSNVQLELGATYYDSFGEDFDFDLGDFDLDNERVNLDLEVIPIDVGVRFNFGDNPLYIAGGGTYYLLDGDRFSVDDEFGYYARVGLQFSSFFVEGGYRDVEGSFDGFSLDFDDADISTSDFAKFDLTGWFVQAGWQF